MKRILALLMMLAMLLPAAASAAIPDVTGLTNAELEELITVAQEELLWRELTGGNGSATAVIEPANEINFRNTTWLISENEFRRLVFEPMGAKVELGEGSGYSAPTSWEINPDKADDYDAELYSNENSGYWIAADHRIKVAGFQVKRMSASFIYGSGTRGSRQPDSTRLFTASYYFDEGSNSENAFESLQRKLTELYGEPETYTTTGKTYRIRHAIWYGDNNTGVRLTLQVKLSDKSTQSLYLRYGLTNSENLLRERAGEASVVQWNSTDNDSFDGL